MEERKLTPLEKKILDEIMRPAISRPENYMMYGFSMSETLHFDTLLTKIKEFYERHGSGEYRFSDILKHL